MQVQDLVMRHSSANSLVMHYGLPVLILASMSKAYNTHALKTSQNSESKTDSAYGLLLRMRLELKYLGEFKLN
jgi:hypothetical protein